MTTNISKQRVKELRDDILRLSQREFAVRLKLSQSAVGHWESLDRVASPDPHILATTFGVSADWVLGLSSQTWGERVRGLQQSLHARIVDGVVAGSTADERVAAVVAWLRTEAEGFAYVDVVANAETERVAALVNVPLAWFETGDASLVASDRWGDVLALCEQERLTPDDVKRLITMTTSFGRR